MCVELKQKRIEIRFDTSHIASQFLLYPYFFYCPLNNYSKLGYGIKIENLFELTVNSELNEYVGCQMKIRRDSIFIHQSKLIKKIYSEFNEDLKSFKCKKTPIKTGQYVTSHDEKVKIFNMDLHNGYQSFFG